MTLREYLDTNNLEYNIIEVVVGANKTRATFGGVKLKYKGGTLILRTDLAFTDMKKKLEEKLEQEWGGRTLDDYDVVDYTPHALRTKSMMLYIKSNRERTKL